MQGRILFLTLKVFSATGGIEKVSRIAGKALYELCLENNLALNVYAMYDFPGQLMDKYFPETVFEGFGDRKTRFVLQSIKKGRGASLVILSHINLLSVAYAIKQLSPKTRVVLLAHGIEVWQHLPSWKQKMLQALDLILPVSEFTREKMQSLYRLPAERLQVVNNCLDPSLLPHHTGKSARLLQKYGLAKEHKILLTLTRLSSRDWYKGYDDVLMALKALKKEEPRLRYLLVGNYDAPEKARLDRLIKQQGLEKEVVFAGFVPDKELAEHFSLADIYVMPSRKEGFGIVFVEALYYGLPVIAGNVDGSVDALDKGRLGLLVDPDEPAAIKAALQHLLQKGNYAVPDRAAVLNRFGYPVYKEALSNVLLPLIGQCSHDGIQLTEPGLDTSKQKVLV